MINETQAASAEPAPPRLIGLEKVEITGRGESSSGSQPSTLNHQPSTKCNVALLTGGGDKPYAIGLATALSARGITLDFVGSNELSVPELTRNERIRFLNLRGDQRPEVSLFRKIVRVGRYYLRLLAYAATAEPKLFHLLWNNKLELFDRTVLMLFYKMMRKRVVFTAHNVNARKRDDRDSLLNRLSLRVQYRLCDHIFVHTEKMKAELRSDFGISHGKVSVIPFGINNTVANTMLSTTEAKRQLGINAGDKTLLFFGNIAPYKGLEYLIVSFSDLLRKDRSYRLIIAGRPKGSPEYQESIEHAMNGTLVRDRIIKRIEYVPDDETELYFKAADVLVLPYTNIFQSGVLFLGYSFGLPALGSDVGSLGEEITEGKTGFVFKPRDSSSLANTIKKYFESDLFRDLASRRLAIKEHANARYSWTKVGEITAKLYSHLLKRDGVAMRGSADFC
jgi:D-inositol-3-phosphate glycosyltransferase